MLVVFAVAAVCLSAPVDGPITADFAPVGRYSGHWGVDYAAEVGAAVRAPVSGTVTFAGSVAGMRTVTIEPVPGFKVSLSYLSEVEVRSGARVSRRSPVGLAGTPHGSPGVHMSTRINGEYVDPAGVMGCQETDISRALRLVEPPRPYPRGRANRNSRWDLRPHPRRPSPYRRVRLVSGRTRSGVDSPRG
ncbi:MAG TPA: M23 family metallopeptidase [Acidimicrobiia bacterium]